MTTSASSIPRQRCFNYLLQYYSESNDVLGLERCWEDMLQLNCTPDFYAYNIALTLYAHQGLREKVLDMLTDMLRNGVQVCLQ